MPLYEYECKKCGLVHEVIHKIEDKTFIFNCPKCDLPMVKKIGSPPFYLKGDGWSSKGRV